jgi:DNA-binding IclR family transcriptional regulator
VELSVSGVGVIDKAVLVLAALEDRPRSLSELVESTGLSRATAHRLATALEVHGLTRRDGDGRFALGVRLVALGRSAADELSLGAAALDALAALRDATGESVQLYVRQGDQRVCVAALESPHGLRTIVPTGASLSMEVGSAAKVLRSDPQSLARGWAESVAEREAGVASVSAPVLDHDGAVVAAVSVSGPVERTSRRPGRRYADAVVRAARAVEEAAGLRVAPEGVGSPP